MNKVFKSVEFRLFAIAFSGCLLSGLVAGTSDFVLLFHPEPGTSIIKWYVNGSIALLSIFLGLVAIAALAFRVLAVKKFGSDY